MRIDLLMDLPDQKWKESLGKILVNAEDNDNETYGERRRAFVVPSPRGHKTTRQTEPPTKI